MKTINLYTLWLFCALCVTSCEKTVMDSAEATDASTDNVTLSFTPSTADITTRGSVTVGDYFSKLNVQLFDADGLKVFDKVKTQLRTDDGFGTLSLSLAPGTYTVVAVGHSSIKSATIKSQEMVQFTASDGEKLTDTFCHCGTVTVGDTGGKFSLTMNRVAAMLQLKLTDDDIPESFSRLKIDYTGGSANFNPSTSQGCTKSSQTENRAMNEAGIYQAFTFPYMATTCSLKVTISALTDDGAVIRQRTFQDVPMTRNRITTYRGPFFSEGDGNITQSDFGFTVNADWESEEVFEF